ncbi:NAD(P)-dependent oxidoreductase [Devosia algicola]|uniref:NAD(P)-dependent oxidoreductase n=1 Tax=Devosia algicola TaxID=3026418 RepID=A0ABY7YQC2_9HYPH|nr:NAD(P)-dependent oxidoreductase [Devosia algicola]WDR03518.1 NAD(P)-dependent oxidoreductase [Devosia algicola]
MTKAIVVGATGHIGTYLVPRLVEAGYEVVAVSRGKRPPYRDNAAWSSVERITLDREKFESEGTFGTTIAELNGDIVIDLICFTLPSAKQLVAALRGRVSHFIHVGTIWTHGRSTVVPTREEAPKHPFGEYGIQKRAIETFLHDAVQRERISATVLHPGHIVGTGWLPVNPAGNVNPDVFSMLARGEPLTLPNFGMETVHHVHADDIARLCLAVLAHRSQSVGESFHAVSEGAVTLRGFAEGVANWFGKSADLNFLPFDEWSKSQQTADANVTWDHIVRSPNCSMDKARRLLDYRPHYGSLEAVQEAVQWLIADGQVRTS